MSFTEGPITPVVLDRAKGVMGTEFVQPDWQERKGTGSESN